MAIIIASILIILGILFWQYIVYSNHEEYVKTQKWLNYIPNEVIVVYSMKGIELPPITDRNEIDDLFILLKKMQFLSKDPERLTGLGYGLKLQYQDYEIEYYFGNPDRVWISKDGKLLNGYMIDEKVGDALFKAFSNISGNN